MWVQFLGQEDALEEGTVIHSSIHLENPKDKGAWQATVHRVAWVRHSGSNLAHMHARAFVLISHASKVMLKILKARLQQYMNQELPDVQTGLEKAEVPKIKFDIHWIIEKAKEFQKNIYFCFIDCAKVFVYVTTNCGKFLKRWEYQTTLPPSCETCMQVKKQHLEPDME